MQQMPKAVKKKANAFRLLHFSDLHLGVENYGRMDPATGLSTRVGDFLRALDILVNYALEEDTHLVLFTGDAYKDRDPSPTLQRELAKRIHRLAQSVPVFLLVGNHDSPPSSAKANTVEIFDTLRVPGVYIGDSPEVQRIETKAGPVQIVALPWIPVSRLRGLEGEVALIQMVENFLAEAVAELDPQVPCVLAAHAMVSGGVFGSERSVLLGQEVVIPKSVLANPALAYVALGHLHRHQVLGQKPPVVYAGSLERVDFGEEKEEKGFVIVEIQEGRANFEFVPLSARPFVTISVALKDDKDPTKRVVKAIGRHEIQNAVVRVVIRATPEIAALIRDEEIWQALEPAYFVAAIDKEIEGRARRRLGMEAEAIEKLSVRELLTRYLEAKKVPAKRKKVLLKYAEELIKEEE